MEDRFQKIMHFQTQLDEQFGLESLYKKALVKPPYSKDWRPPEKNVGKAKDAYGNELDNPVNDYSCVSVWQRPKKKERAPARVSSMVMGQASPGTAHAMN